MRQWWWWWVSNATCQWMSGCFSPTDGWQVCFLELCVDFYFFIFPFSSLEGGGELHAVSYGDEVSGGGGGVGWVIGSEGGEGGETQGKARQGGVVWRG